MPIVTEIKLKLEIIDLIRKNKALKNRLMFELNLSPSTLSRLLDNNSDRLTTAKALSIISEELEIKSKNLLIEE